MRRCDVVLGEEYAVSRTHGATYGSARVRAIGFLSLGTRPGMRVVVEVLWGVLGAGLGAWAPDGQLTVAARYMEPWLVYEARVARQAERVEMRHRSRDLALDLARQMADACGLRVTGGDVVDPDRVAVTIHGDVAEIEAVIEAVARGRRPDERLSPDEVSDRVGAGMRLAAGERVHWPDDEADEGVVLCEGGAWFVRWDRRLEDADEADSSPIDPRTGRLLDFDPPHGPLFVRRVDGEGRR